MTTTTIHDNNNHYDKTTMAAMMTTMITTTGTTTAADAISTAATTATETASGSNTNKGLVICKVNNMQDDLTRSPIIILCVNVICSLQASCQYVLDTHVQCLIGS